MSLGESEAPKCANSRSRDRGFADLRGNDIRSAGAKAIADMLGSNTTIRSLSLEWNSLGLQDGIGWIADALKLNKTLAHVRASVPAAVARLPCADSDVCRVSSKRADRVVRLHVCAHQLDLRNNKIGPEGGVAIAKALLTNSTVTSLGEHTYIRFSFASPRPCSQ